MFWRSWLALSFVVKVAHSYMVTNLVKCCICTVITFAQYADLTCVQMKRRLSMAGSRQ